MAIDESMWADDHTEPTAVADVAMGEGGEEGERPARSLLTLLSDLKLEDAAAAAAAGEPMEVDQPDHIGDHIGDHIDRLMGAATAELADKLGHVFAAYVACLNDRIARLEEDVARLSTAVAAGEARTRRPGSQERRPAHVPWPVNRSGPRTQPRWPASKKAPNNRPRTRTDAPSLQKARAVVPHKATATGR